MPSIAVDVAVFGGGIAGLWSLDALRRLGYAAVLLESSALGKGQTVHAQGIIHGGGKYALRSVRDFSAMAAIREMPQRWRRSLSGVDEPDLSSAQLLSDGCNLWLPKGSLLSWIASWGIMPVVSKAGMLSSRPHRIDKANWPSALRDSARAVYAMAEPVVATGSVLGALADRHPSGIWAYHAGDAAKALSARSENGGVVLAVEHPRASGTLEVAARAVVLAAGAGNDDLLHRLGVSGEHMQRRPLTMVMLRGELPRLYAHCVHGGKTALTITTHPDRDGSAVWQLGGEVAERHAATTDAAVVQTDALVELRRYLPAFDPKGLAIASYATVRAEARGASLRRPSGVDATWLADRVLAAWPTKMALAPMLADEVCAAVGKRIGAPAERPACDPIEWPRPDVAAYPWEEERTWTIVD